ncbi:MAG: TlyA family RNA methyltransferase [Pseudomonadota bacterium]
MPSERLDKVLVKHEGVRTRSQARDLIKRGQVRVDGRIVTKPGSVVPEHVDICITQDELNYVSRGALKLKAALRYFDYSVQNAIALDVGASTGGFTQMLLEQGAQKVYAIDVGQGQLSERLTQDPKVIYYENQDARTLNQELIPDLVHIITVDVSFISLQQVLPRPFALTTDSAFLIALIKPQFQVGKEGLGKGGIVRDANLKDQAVKTVRAWMDEQSNWEVEDVIPSPITGGGGNEEFLLGARRQPL